MVVGILEIGRGILDLEFGMLGLYVQIVGLRISDREFDNWAFAILCTDLSIWNAHLSFSWILGFEVGI